MASQQGRPEFRPVTAERLDEFKALFLSRGAPHFCWCMAWRALDKAEPGQTPKARRQASMERRIRAGEPVGILCYIDGEPVGWCSIAPRETYKPLGGVEGRRNVWSLACFFVLRQHRGGGLGRALLEAAVEHARRSGAEAVEAYPADAGGVSYRFMGYRSTFEKAGFSFVKRAGTRRNVMLLELGGNP